MKKIQKIILAFMLGILPLQSALADSKADALANAVFKGNLEQVKTLIEKEGVDINARETETKFGFTALMVASGNGYLEIVKYLISKGADINAKANNGATALMWASDKGHLGIIKALVEGKSGLLSVFSKGADINAKDNDNATALMWASDKGHLEVVKYLINKGADINAKIDNGRTALMMASAAGHLEVVKALVEGKKGLLSMFSKGADINAKSNDGETALLEASAAGHLEVVKYLISKGANVNAVMSVEIGIIYRRVTALDVAKIAKHYKVVEVLRKAGAKTAKEIKK